MGNSPECPFASLALRGIVEPEFIRGDGSCGAHHEDAAITVARISRCCSKTTRDLYEKSQHNKRVIQGVLIGTDLFRAGVIGTTLHEIAEGPQDTSGEE